VISACNSNWTLNETQTSSVGNVEIYCQRDGNYWCTVGFEELYSALSNNYNISNITELNTICNRCPSLILNSLALYGTLVSSVTDTGEFFATQFLCVQDNNGNYCSTEEIQEFADCASLGNSDYECDNFFCTNQCAANGLVTTWLGQFALVQSPSTEAWAEYKPEICYMKGTSNEIIMEIHLAILHCN
jgi:hypothetical protein